METTAGDSEGRGPVSVDAGARLETQWSSAVGAPGRAESRGSLHSLSPVRRAPPERKGEVAGGATCRAAAAPARERILGRE